VLIYFEKSMSQLKKASWKFEPGILTFLHDSAPAHRSQLDKLLYLSKYLKKCIRYHIIMIRHRVITICFQIQRKASLDRNFLLITSSSMQLKTVLFITMLRHFAIRTG